MKNSKKSLVYLYHHGTPKYTLCNDFGVSIASLTRWIKFYNTENIDLNEATNILQMYEIKKTKIGTRGRNFCFIRSYHDF